MGFEQKAPGWRSVDTPHFRLFSDLSEGAAVKTAEQLEAVREALLTIEWNRASDPPGRTEVVVFARPSEFHRVYPVGQVGGIAVSHEGQERLLAFFPGGRTGVPPVAIHELVHDLSQWFMPLQPRWFSEGLAEYLEDLDIDLDSGKAVIGGVNKNATETMNGLRRHLKVEELLSTEVAIQQDPRESALFYATSWLFVHYLHNRQTPRFLGDRERLKRTGLAPQDAMTSAAKWVRTMAGGGNPVLVAYPLSFDWLWLYWYFVRFSATGSPFGHSKCFDVKTAFAAKGRMRMSEAGRSRLPPALRSSHPHTHSALDDAIEQAEIFAKVFEWEGQL